MFFGDSSRASQKKKMQRNLSNLFDAIASEISLMMYDINSEIFEENKGLESSVSPRGDLNAWEQIRRIDEQVREILGSRDTQKETKFPFLRRESMSHALVSHISNTILESAKSDANSIMVGTVGEKQRDVATKGEVSDRELKNSTLVFLFSLQFSSLPATRELKWCFTWQLRRLFVRQKLLNLKLGREAANIFRCNTRA